MKISTADSLLLQRYLDRELPADAAEAFRRRLDADPELAAAAAAHGVFAAGFAAARRDVRVAPAGFAHKVLAGVRQLPARAQLEAEATSAVVVRVCRRVLLAAVVLFAMGLALRSGLLDGGFGEQLQAAPEEVEAEMQRLDALAARLDAASLDGAETRPR